MKTQPNESAESLLRRKILHLMEARGYQPLDSAGIARKLQSHPGRLAEIKSLLRKMEGEGQIARIRQERYLLPQTADLVTGIIQMHQGGAGHILTEVPGESDVYVASENTGTAMHGDRVVARLLREQPQQRGRGGKPRRQGRGGAEAAVIRILHRSTDTLVGTLQRSKNFYYVISDSPRMVHHVYVQPGSDALPRIPAVGDKVVVKLEPWESREVNPEGRIIEILGPASSPGVDLLSIIRKYDLPSSFPGPVEEEARHIAEEIPDREIALREDLRQMEIFTIDPDDARDFDDAICVERTGAGWILGVHIADVSHYVRPGSALDREAYKRGNSIYLPDRVIPMLPEQLSNGICSLKPHVERLTLSVFAEFTRNGRIKSVRFARTVIRSSSRLTYKEAFAILQKPAVSALDHRVHTAWELASVLRKNRFAAGSLDLDFPEVKVVLDENKRAIRLDRIENDISHQLVEEFMLVANEVVARELKNRQIPAIYRIHEQPDPDRLLEYREFVASYGFKVGDLTNRQEVQRFLGQLRGKPEEYALKLGFLKSLKRAVYGVTSLGHYGLAKVNYTHFTSPIRRYADLIVHRAHAQLIAGAKPARLAPADLATVAEHVSATERVASDAEKESVKLKKIEYFGNQLKQRNPREFRAVVVEVRGYGLLVELPDYLATGMIHVSALPDDFYEFDSVRQRFVGRRRRKTFQIGNILRVIVARVDVYKQQIDFQPVG